MLYFVATPIGNLNDVSYRAIETLKNSDVILCEDTRTSRTFLDHYQIEKQLLSFHKFNYKEMTPKVIDMLKEGKNISLITDAGTPCISDPGSELIQSLNENDIKYTIIPGASAFLNAFCLSGFSAPFTFVGFLPDNKKMQKSFYENCIAIIHNNFAEQANAKRFDQARQVLEAGMQVFPDDKTLKNDLNMLNRMTKN